MSKNLVVKSIGQGETWTCPAGVEIVQMIARSYGVSLAGGEAFGLGIDVDGKLYSWGRNNQGQLATNNLTFTSSPVAVVGPTTRLFKYVAGGQTHALAIGTDGVTYCWGTNIAGELGDGSIAASGAAKSSPVAVAGSHSFKVVATGVQISGALDTTGAAWMWGSGTAGKLGDNTNISKSTPVAVVGGLKFVSLSINNEGSFSAALDVTGDAYVWGSNQFGQTGIGLSNGAVSSPTAVLGSHKFKQLSAGSAHCLAIDNLGNLWAWGRNIFGTLGNGNTTDVSTPVQSTTGMKWIYVLASTNTSYGITADGTLWSWGRGSAGELGDGTLVDKSSPVQVAGGGKWRYVAANTQAVHATKSDGTSYSWGAGSDGRLGTNSEITRSSPVLIVGNKTFIPAETTLAAVANVDPGTVYTASFGATSSTFANAVFPIADVKEILLIYQA